MAAHGTPHRVHSGRTAHGTCQGTLGHEAYWPARGPAGARPAGLTRHCTMLPTFVTNILGYLIRGAIMHNAV